MEIELGPTSVREYLRTPESNQPEELRYGWVVREPTPSTGHQAIMTGIQTAVVLYVTERALGFVVHHMDVVLDEKLRLVVQPDLLVVLNERRHILREGRVWGPPNLTVEVLSPSNRRHDRLRKLAWYRQYGVQEYWIVDPVDITVEVLDLEAEPSPAVRIYGESDILESRVLQGFNHPVAKFFEHRSSSAKHTRCQR
jgi:Uma2 family endonuclease